MNKRKSTLTKKDIKRARILKGIVQDRQVVDSINQKLKESSVWKRSLRTRSMGVIDIKAKSYKDIINLHESQNLKKRRKKSIGAYPVNFSNKFMNQCGNRQIDKHSTTKSSKLLPFLSKNNDSGNTGLTNFSYRLVKCFKKRTQLLNKFDKRFVVPNLNESSIVQQFQEQEASFQEFKKLQKLTPEILSNGIKEEFYFPEKSYRYFKVYCKQFRFPCKLKFFQTTVDADFYIDYDRRPTMISNSARMRGSEIIIAGPGYHVPCKLLIVLVVTSTPINCYFGASFIGAKKNQSIDSHLEFLKKQSNKFQFDINEIDRMESSFHTRKRRKTSKSYIFIYTH